MENLNRIVLATDRFAALIPTQGKSWAVTLQIRTVELDRRETSVSAQSLRDDLVGRDTVGHVLTRHGIAICPGQPKGAAPVSFVGELI